MHFLVRRHAKKRKGTSIENPKVWFTVLDRFVLTVGIIGPLTDIPQILKLLATQNATGVSGLAWAGAALCDFPFIIYGLAHKDKIITTTYSLWFLGNISVLVLTILYT
ncbi:MAG TPA: hypothetical protein VMU27_01775 [Candidatus Paceibacterota bacterium]|nr:hypothetical protein [Candidatus Paceibacterota bacterium]